MDALQAQQAHEARHAMPSDALLELVVQLGVDAPGAVRAAAIPMDGFDDLAQRGVGDVTP